MRIISGSFRGKKIHEPKDIKTRPLKDLTKESIFNIIKHSQKFSINLESSEILDLFSGTGSFGIECLSRGAKYVTFVENYERILPILKKNLDNLNSQKNYSIFEKNILNDFNLVKLKKNFDIIFLDPPYNFSMDQYLDLINVIKQRNLLFENGEIIIEHSSNISLIEKNNKIDERKYGSSILSFIKKASL